MDSCKCILCRCGKFGEHGTSCIIEQKHVGEITDCPLDRLTNYDNTEEQGLLIRLPCKTGEVVWVYYPKYKEIERVSYMTQSEILEDIELGAIICRTREDAEAKLEKES